MKQLNKKDWELSIFTDVVKDITGGNRKFQTDEYKLNGAFPIIDQGEKFIAGFTDEDSKANRTNSVVIFGDHTKKIKFVDFDFCLGADGVKILEPCEKLNAKYLYFCLLNLRLPDVGYSRHYKFLKETQIPLPPLTTQKYIAQILDKADALRKKDQQLLKYYDELAQSLFINLFGNPVKNEKGWEVKKLGEVLCFLTSGSRGWAKYYSEEGEIFLRINNVGANQLKLKDIIYVNAPDAAEAKRTVVQPDDILMSITADIGKTAVIPQNFPKAFINQHLALIRLKSTANPHFVSEVISSDLGKNHFFKVVKGGVKSGINFDDIKTLPIIFPPIQLQDKFAQQIQNIEKQKEKVKAQMQTSEETFQALLQQVFA